MLRTTVTSAAPGNTCTSNRPSGYDTTVPSGRIHSASKLSVEGDTKHAKVLKAENVPGCTNGEPISSTSTEVVGSGGSVGGGRLWSGTAKLILIQAALLIDLLLPAKTES